jgi:TPP-dependent pyruvate/acetoin dehydrogenase alpha subunit
MTEALVADLTREDLHALFYAMLLARAAEERLEVLFKQGHIKGGLYRSLGQEAGCVGAAYALRRRTDGTGDVLGQTVRATGAVFLFNGTPLEFFRQYLARATSPTAGREANVHWTDFDRGLLGPVSPLGTMVEIMSGITLSFRLRGEDRVGMVFYGDGASSTGAWHEGLNFAAAQRCPMILMVEANQWAFSTPTSKQTRVKSFTEKGPGYGIATESVDGTEVIAVYEAVRRAADRARNGDGASLVELRYFRRKGHAQHDAQEYVPEADIEYWRERDPVGRLRHRLLEAQWATEEELDALAERAVDRTREAAEQAVGEALPDGREAIRDVYTDVALPAPWTRRDFPEHSQPMREER